MSFSSPRRGKSRISLPAERRARLGAWRPLLETMEDRVVLTAAVTPHQSTVTQLYQDLLHRLPDAGGLAYWTNQLDAGANTGAVAAALTHSTEFHRGEVDGVYQRLLNRPADNGGRAFFASSLDNGQSVQQVESAVASSPEYAQSHAGFLDALFNGTDHLKTLVNGAYEQVLRRAGDSAGLDYWAGRMAAGASLDDVTASLAGSAEHAAMAVPTATVFGTFADASNLPRGGVGALEASLAGSVHGALGAGAGSAPQAVALKNGPPAVFQAFGPERLVDTRNTVNGQYGGPAFVVGGTRTINVSPYNLSDPSIPSAAIGDQAPTSNLPANVVAVSVILFIVGAPQPEYFTAYATGTSPAPTATATVFADHAGQIIAASAIVPVNALGNIDIYSSGGGNLIVDITGYFLDQLDGTDNLPISGSVPGNGVIVGTNASTTSLSSGVIGTISSTSSSTISTAGVRGINNGTGGIGVWGSQAGSGWGVYGTAAGAGFGGNFIAGTGGYGVVGSSSGAGSRGGDFFGLLGVVGLGAGASASAEGVSGTAPRFGVFGLSTDATNGIATSGTASGTGSFGLFAFGNSGASGTKSFVDPNPTDASTQIRYISLEGNEAGTYFRGTGHFTNGVATLDVPQDFRLVTDPTGLSIQVTPVGGTPNVGVKSIDLNHVVVMGTQDVDFFYTVNGVRKGYAGFNPIETNTIYVPRSASDTLPTWLAETQKQSLIANGTYNADGTVNLATAHRMGWDVLWAENGAHGTPASSAAHNG